MKFRNTLGPDYPDHAIRRMLSWVAREVGYPIRKLRRADFCKSRNHWGGLCHGNYRIGVRVGVKESWPCTHRRFGLSHVCHDPWDALIATTAHELAHSLDYIESGTTNERSADLQTQQVYQLWLTQKESLLPQWRSEPVKRQTDSSTLQQRRALHAQTMLARWQRKAKLAATKIRIYKRKVAYYHSALATPEIHDHRLL
jgi:hypothetical protein